MIGNDVTEDMIAKRMGMEEYLITDCMINKAGEDISCYRHGTMEELVAFAKENM